VPEAATNMSTLPAVSFQISGPSFAINRHCIVTPCIEQICLLMKIP
jgi:hypothetical protein